MEPSKGGSQVPPPYRGERTIRGEEVTEETDGDGANAHVAALRHLPDDLIHYCPRCLGDGIILRTRSDGSDEAVSCPECR